MKRKVLEGTAALIFWLAVWQGVALLVRQPLLLPGPLAVGVRLCQLAATAAFWQTTALSLGRIAAAVVVGVAAGTVLAVGATRFRLVHLLFAPLLSVITATPVASFILLALLFLGRSLVPPLIAMLMVVPVVFGAVEAAIAAVPAQLLEMAAAFRLPRLRRLRRIYVPSVLPQFLSAVRTSIGLAWKAGVAAEVLTVPLRSIGRALYQSKLTLETTDLFAWTAVTVLCSVLLERLTVLLMKRLERRRRHDSAA